MGYLPDNKADLDKTSEDCEMWLKDPENMRLCYQTTKITLCLNPNVNRLN